MRIAVAALTLCLLAGTVPASARANDGLQLVGTIAAPGAISARLIQGPGAQRWLYVSTGTGFLVYDVTDPEDITEVGRLPLPTYQNEDLDGNADLALLANDSPVSAAIPGSPAGGQVVVVSTADKTHPAPMAVVSLPDGAGHTLTCLDNCRWALASGGATLAAVDLTTPERPVVHRVPAPVGSGIVHDANQDADGVVWLAGSKGMTAVAMRPILTQGAAVAGRTRGATPLKPVLLTGSGAPGTTLAIRAGTLHGSLRPADIAYGRRSGFKRGEILLAGEEGTADDCRAGGKFHTFDARGVRDGAPLRLLDSVAPAESKASLAPGFGAACSAHWFTHQGPLVAVAWFGAGLRILDVTDPWRIRQVGRYVPQEPRTWSAYWLPGSRYVLALDLHRGIDVLEVTARPGSAEVGALQHGTPARSIANIVDGSLCQ